MHRSGHIGLALLFVAPFAFIVSTTIGIGLGIAVLALGLIVADIPDRDQAIPGMSHRGISHTVWAALAVSMIGGFGAYMAVTRLHSGPVLQLPGFEILTNTPPLTIAGVSGVSVFLGYISHIFADMITVGSKYFGMDVKPLYPVIDIPIQFGIVKSDSWVWNSALFGAGVVIAGAVVMAGI